MISSESWDEIEAAFSAGLALGPEEREQLLRAADPALAGEVRRLWGNWANASGFLASPAVSFEGIPLLVSGQEVLGRFVVIDRLGVGGMSEVYRARDTVLGRLVALKLMQRDLGGNRERLEHEARAISSLSHPNIRSLYDLGWEENLPILVMEHLEGETLAQRLERGPISLADVLSYAVEILKALEHAHAKGIVHRDVKPGNIFLTDSGAKLLDFGIATSQESPAMAAEIAGSPGYMSPEQLNGESLDARSDIYSFGRVLEQMIESRERSVRSRLEFVAHRCVAKEPVERFQSAAALRQALEEIATKTSQSRFLDRRSVAIILAMAIGVAGLGWWSWKRSRESSQGPHYGVPIRLTVEGGLAQDAVISPDGKTVAFASDRSGNFDIYVQDIATGQATQLTNSPFDEKRPSFSPDGNNIVFQSSELGAGISVVPARGGSIRHVVANGYDPRVSPDGRRIAYWTSPSDDSTIGTSAKMYIVDFRGGPPTHLAVNFITGGNPIWSEDGQYLIFSGIALNKLRDWHYIRLKDMKTGSVHALSMLDNIGKTGALIRASFCYGGAIYGSAYIGTTWYLVSVPLRPGRPPDAAGAKIVNQSVTKIEAFSDARDGSIAFTSSVLNEDLYRFRLNPATGTGIGKLERLTNEVSNERSGSISDDGRILAYASDRDGTSGFWVRDLKTGTNRKLHTVDGGFVAAPAVSPDGALVAYTDADISAVVVTSRGAFVARVPDMGAIAWKNNRELIVGMANAPGALETSVRIFDVLTKSISRASINSDPSCSWMAGYAINYCEEPQENGSLKLSLAKPDSRPPFHFLGYFRNEPFIFSTTKGDFCYWFGQHEGHDSVYGVRLNPSTAAPVGKPFVAYEFPANVRVAGGPRNNPEIRNHSVVVTLTERNSNIWIEHPLN